MKKIKTAPLPVSALVLSQTPKTLGPCLPVRLPVCRFQAVPQRPANSQAHIEETRGARVDPGLPAVAQILDFSYRGDMLPESLQVGAETPQIIVRATV